MSEKVSRSATDIEQGVEVRILGYKEDDEWVALALEMDLRGYGPSFEMALEELDTLVQAQISFALHKKNPDSVFKDAEPKYFEIYETKRREAMKRALSENSRNAHKAKYAFSSLPIPAPHVIDSMRKSGRYRTASAGAI